MTQQDFPSQQFWVIWCPQGGAPTKKHGSYNSARDEAVRLWKNNPGKDFYILQPVSRVHAAGFQITAIEAPKAAEHAAQPLKLAPRRGDGYWSIYNGNVMFYQWWDTEFDVACLRAGLAFATQEDAKDFLAASKARREK